MHVRFKCLQCKKSRFTVKAKRGIILQLLQKLQTGAENHMIDKVVLICPRPVLKFQPLGNIAGMYCIERGIVEYVHKDFL